jgi:hypothetical protein
MAPVKPTASGLIAVALTALACARDGAQQQPRELAQSVKEPAATSAPAAPTAPRSYGDKIGAGEQVPLSRVLAAPEGFTQQPVIITGKVRKACSRKGCWMELAESLDATAAGCRVTFKDYGFFVPTDSAGADARVRASVTVETVAASYVKHLEEEGATFSQKNPDGTAREVRLVATGVELVK